MKKVKCHLKANGDCARAIYELINTIPCTVYKYIIGKSIELELGIRTEDVEIVKEKLGNFI